MLTSLLIFAGCGIIVGILSGLLGVGGGVVIVPVMVFSLDALGFDQAIIMKLSIGTSLATIVFTSVSSVLAHHKRGAVLWDIVKILSIGIVLGVFCGSFLVSYLSNQALKIIFVLFMLFVVIKMLFPTKSTNIQIIRIPLNKVLILIGWFIGFLSSLVGIGGGAVTVPALNMMGYDMRKAIASSAACGFPIALTGAIAYVITGWSSTSMAQHHSLGYIYLPGLFGIAITSILFAPLGAKISHSLPIAVIKKIFAFFLLFILFKLLFL